MNEYKQSIIEMFIDDVKHCDMYSPEGALITEAYRSEHPNLCLHVKYDTGTVYELSEAVTIDFIAHCTFEEDFD